MTSTNALTHGILSAYSVLPWENPDDFRHIHKALLAEYEPKGMTERHLVDELADIIWRKRRLQRAGLSLHQETLSKILHPIFPDAAPMLAAMAGVGTAKSLKIPPLEEWFYTPNEDRNADIAETMASIDHINTLINSTASYATLKKQVHPDIWEHWQEHLSEDPECYQKTALSFQMFIRDICLPMYQNYLANLQAQSVIRQHILQSASLPTDKINTLSRYETHLDRKFERTVAMLIKLAEMRKILE
jgi:hypothetical protein